MKTIVCPAIGNPKRGYRQKKFVLSTFTPVEPTYKGEEPAAVTREAVITCRDVGFNMIESGWVSPRQMETILPTCEEIGLDMIWQDLGRCGGMQGRKIAPGVTEDTVREIVKEIKKNKHCIGFYVWDEPYLDDQMDRAREQADWYEKYAPGDLIFTVAIPSYNLELTWDNGEFPKYLRTFVETVQPPVLSLDYYPIGLIEQGEDRPLDMSRLWFDLALMKQLCAEYKLPLWFYFQGQDVWESGKLTFPMVRLFMHVGALYGAKGLQHYTAWDSVVDPKTGGHGIFFDEQKKMNARFVAWGPTLMALSCRGIYHDSAVCAGVKGREDLFDDVKDSAVLASALPAHVSASEHVDPEGRTYLMVLNRDYDNALTIDLPLKKAARLWTVSPDSGEQTVFAENAKSVSLTLPPSEMVLLRVQDPAEPAEPVCYTVE